MDLSTKLENSHLNDNETNPLRKLSHKEECDLTKLHLDDQSYQKEIIDYSQNHPEFMRTLIGKIPYKDIKAGENLYAITTLRDQIIDAFKDILKNGDPERKQWCLRVIISCFENVDSLAIPLVSLLQEKSHGPESLLVLMKLKTRHIEDAVEEYVDDLLLQESYRSAFIIMSRAFYIMTEAMSRIFTSEPFNNAVANNISRNMNTQELLNLFSEASVVEQNRKFIAENYLDFIARQAKVHSRTSLLVLSKLWNNIDLKSFQEKHPDVDLSALLVACTAELTSDSIETLAYLTLKVSVKKRIRPMSDFKERCVNVLKTCTDQIMRFGILTILTNLTQIPAKQSDLERVVNSAEKDDVQQILQLSHTLLNLEIVGTCTRNKSKGCLAQSVRLLFNLSYKKISRVDVIKQGGIEVLLKFLIAGSAGHIDYVERKIQLLEPLEDPQSRLIAAKTLAKLLFYSDPRLSFINTDPITAVPFLCEIVQDYVTVSNQSQNLIFDGIEVTMADVFEALHSLTNLASGDSMAIRGLISKLIINPLIQLMQDENELLQREACQLLGNISYNNVDCIHVFFNWQSHPSTKVSFEQVSSLLLVSDTETLIAILNFFCHVSSFPDASCLLADSKEFIRLLVRLLDTQPDNKDVVHRCLIVLTDLLESIPDGVRVFLRGKDDILKRVTAAHNDAEITALVHHYVCLLNGGQPDRFADVS